MKSDLEFLVKSMIIQAECQQQEGISCKDFPGLTGYAAHCEGIAAGLMLAVKWIEEVVREHEKFSKV